MHFDRDHMSLEEEERTREASEDLRNPDKRDELQLLQLFKKEFSPRAEHLYYPGCGLDRALRAAFPDSNITYLEADVRTWQLRTKQEQGRRSRVEYDTAEEYVPREKVDVLYGCHASFSMAKALESVREGGYYLCTNNDSADVFDAALRHPDFRLRAVLRVREPLEAIANVCQLVLGRIQATLRDATRKYVTQRDGLEAHMTPIASDEEIAAKRPHLLEDFRENIAEDGWKGPVLDYIHQSRFGAVNSPKQASARSALYVFERTGESR